MTDHNAIYTIPYSAAMAAYIPKAQQQFAGLNGSVCYLSEDGNWLVGKSAYMVLFHQIEQAPESFRDTSFKFGRAPVGDVVIRKEGGALVMECVSKKDTARVGAEIPAVHGASKWRELIPPVPTRVANCPINAETIIALQPLLPITGPWYCSSDGVTGAWITFRDLPRLFCWVNYSAQPGKLEENALPSWHRFPDLYSAPEKPAEAPTTRSRQRNRPEPQALPEALPEALPDTPTAAPRVRRRS